MSEQKFNIGDLVAFNGDVGIVHRFNKKFNEYAVWIDNYMIMVEEHWIRPATKKDIAKAGGRKYIQTLKGTVL
ncbi:hypothetical protein 049ML003_43 [Bacillus phage 049ML003]|nr:hypothetical protein 049ML003_43 [Bacillus phage 049ML003]